MRRHYILAATILALQVATSPQAQATMKWYYDPLTGNVSFDSSDTRSGEIFIYSFGLNTGANGVAFRPENLVRLSSTPFFDASRTSIGEGNLDYGWKGLYTIGNVLPAGLSEQFWTSAVQSTSHTVPFNYSYVDLIGGGQPGAAQMIYGAPTGEYKNSWDAVDPNTLQWATTAKLIYRQSDGNVTLDTTGDTGGYIAGFELESNAQFDPFAFKRPNSGPFYSADPSLLGLFSNAIAPGQYELGPILEAGLSPAEFEAKFTSAKFVGRLGYGIHDLNLGGNGLALSLQFSAAVPEPCGMALAVIATVIACGGHRRRSL